MGEYKFCHALLNLLQIENIRFYTSTAKREVP